MEMRPWGRPVTDDDSDDWRDQPDAQLWQQARKARKTIKKSKVRAITALRELPKVRQRARKNAKKTLAMRTQLTSIRQQLITARSGKGPKGTHIPTPSLRALVMNFRGTGMSMHNIAKMMGTTVHTLRTYYAQELDVGEIEANYLVANTLFRVATDVNHPGVVPAARRWLEVRAVGWNPTHRVEEVKSESTAPIIDSKRLTPDERLQLAELMEKIIAREAENPEQEPESEESSVVEEVMPHTPVDTGYSSQAGGLGEASLLPPSLAASDDAPTDDATDEPATDEPATDEPATDEPAE
jgi:hypothetical protein